MSDPIDLDAYRERRIAEGTWPPSDPAEVRAYWKERRDQRIAGGRPKPGYEPPKSEPPPGAA